MAAAFTEENFEAEVLQSDKPVLVDFWAEWCGPCKMLLPTIDKLATAYEGKAVVGKVNIDESRDIAVKYGIQSIPTVLVFKGGEVVETFVGLSPEKVYAEALDNHA